MEKMFSSEQVRSGINEQATVTLEKAQEKIGKRIKKMVGKYVAQYHPFVGRIKIKDLDHSKALWYEPNRNYLYHEARLEDDQKVPYRWEANGKDWIDNGQEIVKKYDAEVLVIEEVEQKMENTFGQAGQTFLPA